MDKDQTSLIRCPTLDQFADCFSDDVIHNIAGRVIDPAGFAHFGLFFNLRLSARGQADDLAEKLLIYLPKDFHRDFLEDIGTGAIEVIMMSFSVRLSLNCWTRLWMITGAGINPPR